MKRISCAKPLVTWYNVHITQFGGEIWKNNIILRNYLLHNKEAAQKYSDLKRTIVSHGASMLLEYSNRKDSCIKELLDAAKSYYKYS